MSLDRYDPLVLRLIADEGWRNEPYKDSRGFWTLGVGHLIDSRQGGYIPTYIRSFPISDDLVARMLENDIAVKRTELLSAAAWIGVLDGPRINVFMSMAFQMGVPRFLMFSKMLEAARAKDWMAASAAGRASIWAREQSPQRASRLMRVLETGEELV